MAAAATSVGHTSDTARLAFPPGPEMIAAVAALCVAETGCCAQTRFLMDITASQVTLTVEAPGSADLLDTLLPGQHTCPAMNAATGVLVIATATAFLLLLWVIGHLVTMVGERAPYGLGRPRQYLAGGLDRIQIIVLVYGEGELLVSLSTPDTEVTDDRLARVFRVAASECRRGPGPALAGSKARSFAASSATTAPSCSPIPYLAAMPPASRP